MGEEKALNPRLSKTLPQFVDIMNNLKLEYPKMIGSSLPPPFNAPSDSRIPLSLSPVLWTQTSRSLRTCCADCSLRRRTCSQELQATSGRRTDSLVPMTLCLRTSFHDKNYMTCASERARDRKITRVWERDERMCLCEGEGGGRSRSR